MTVKEIVEHVVAFVRKAMGMEESVDTIMSPLTKISNKLEKHEAAKKAEADRRAKAAERAKTKSAEAAEAAARAASQRDALKAFTS